MKPTRLRLDAASYCQLRCPSCPTTSRAIHPAVGSGFLKAKDFENLLTANPGLRSIELSNYGEILLNPELEAIIECAFRHNVRLRADNGVNFNFARPETLEAMVRYRFRSINCSIDGASPETYARYRVRGDFERVLANIAKLNELKRQFNSPYPRLRWQFVVFGYNEHEIERARSMAEELDMGFNVKLSWDPDFAPVGDQEMVRNEVGAASRAEFKEVRGSDYAQATCHQLWEDPQINWDGKVLGCCRNFWGDFGGNAFAQGLSASLAGEKLGYAKRMLLGQAPARPDIPCTTCDIYQHMQATERWLKRPVSVVRLWRGLLDRLELDRFVG